MTPATRVAVFTDNDFEKVNGVTTALAAALAGAPPDVRVRVYTASRLGCATDDYLALPSWGVGIPFYRDMLMYWPPYQRIVDWMKRDGINVVHLTTPGPMGLAALAAARRLRLPLIGSFHTDLARYTRVLSGSPTLEACMRRYMRWLYGHCIKVLVPSQATRALVVCSGLPSARLGLWTRGVDAQAFSPSRRSAALRAEWRTRDDRPVLLYAGRVSREKGVDQLPLLSAALTRLGVDHRLVVVGDGPMRAEVAAACPDAVCPGCSAANGWPKPTLRPICLFFPAAPTPPATSCSKPRPRACRCWSPRTAGHASSCVPGSPASSARRNCTAG